MQNSLRKDIHKVGHVESLSAIMLDEESRKYVVINTRCGLFQNNQLPFGVALVPGIVQKVMVLLSLMLSCTLMEYTSYGTD